MASKHAWWKAGAWLGLFAWGATASAAAPKQPPKMSDAVLATFSPEQATVESRLEADFTGDGLRDLAVVVRNDDVRVLETFQGYVGDDASGYEPLGKMAMDPSPLGSAGLSVQKGVLLVEDLTGGTSAVQSRYRFRYDPGEAAMRLIGDDVSYYSRTNQHDSLSISTNRLTGTQLVTRSVLGDDGTYADKPAQRKKVSSAPIYMDDAPTPEDTLGLDD